MSLYNLWRLRIGLSVVFAMFSVCAVAWGRQGAWDVTFVTFAAGALLVCAGLAFPWSRYERPPAGRRVGAP